LFRFTSISAVGANGRQICVPSFVRGNSTFVMPEGLSVIVPLTLDIKGKLLTSSIFIINSLFDWFHVREDGPIVSLCGS
jgi:hypothetical protein